MRRLLVVPIVVVIVWSLILFAHGVAELARDRQQPGVIGTIVVLPLLVTACSWIAARLWRSNTPQDPR